MKTFISDFHNVVKFNIALMSPNLDLSQNLSRNVSFKPWPQTTVALNLLCPVPCVVHATSPLRSCGTHATQVLDGQMDDGRKDGWMSAWGGSMDDEWLSFIGPKFEIH